jgi:hypothetical protein
MAKAVQKTPKQFPSTLRGAISFGLATPEACKEISPGYAFFAYPGSDVES